MTNGLPRLAAHGYHSKPAAQGTFLQFRRVPAIAVSAHGLAGLIAAMHRFDLAAPATSLVIALVPVPALLIAIVTNSLAFRGTAIHPFGLTTLGAFLVIGRIFAVARLTGQLTGFAVPLEDPDLAAQGTLSALRVVFAIAPQTSQLAGFAVPLDDPCLAAQGTSSALGIVFAMTRKTRELAGLFSLLNRSDLAA
ncbi:MAG: hypothetical protein WDN47_00185 [Candidatus Doudnabacteria bacterium]